MAIDVETSGHLPSSPGSWVLGVVFFLEGFRVVRDQQLCGEAPEIQAVHRVKLKALHQCGEAGHHRENIQYVQRQCNEKLAPAPLLMPGIDFDKQGSSDSDNRQKRDVLDRQKEVEYWLVVDEHLVLYPDSFPHLRVRATSAFHHGISEEMVFMMFITPPQGRDAKHNAGYPSTSVIPFPVLEIVVMHKIMKKEAELLSDRSPAQGANIKREAPTIV